MVRTKIEVCSNVSVPELFECANPLFSTFHSHIRLLVFIVAAMNTFPTKTIFSYIFVHSNLPQASMHDSLHYYNIDPLAFHSTKNFNSHSYTVLQSYIESEYWLTVQVLNTRHPLRCF